MNIISPVDIASKPFRMTEDGDGNIWVTYWCGPFPNGAPVGHVHRAEGYVAKISPGSNRHRNHAHGRFFPVGHFPTGIAYGDLDPYDDGRQFKTIFVANFDSHTISVLNANNGNDRHTGGFTSPYEIKVGGNALENPSAVAFDGRHLWVAFNPHGTSVQWPNYSVVKCDPMNGNVVAHLNGGGPNPFGCPIAILYIGPGDGTGDIWVANSGYTPNYQSTAVFRFDAETANFIRSYTVGDNPAELLWDKNYVWVANNAGVGAAMGKGSVSYIDPVSHGVNHISIPNTRPHGLALEEIDANNRFIHVTDSQPSTPNHIHTIRVNSSTGSPPTITYNPTAIPPIPVGNTRPMGIQKKNGKFFIATFEERDAGAMDATGFTDTRVLLKP